MNGPWKKWYMDAIGTAYGTKPAKNKTLVWFVDGPCAGDNVMVTRGVTNYLCHVTKANYQIDWREPCPMAFFAGWTV